MNFLQKKKKHAVRNQQKDNGIMHIAKFMLMKGQFICYILKNK